MVITQCSLLIIGDFAEHENVSIGVAYFELPVAIGLFDQLQMNRHVLPNGFVELPDASHSEIRVPSAARPGNFRLLVTLRSQQHDFDPVALEAGEDIRLVLGKRTDREPEMLFIPLRSGADVVDEKRRGSRKKTWVC